MACSLEEVLSPVAIFKYRNIDVKAWRTVRWVYSIILIFVVAGLSKDVMLGMQTPGLNEDGFHPK